MLATDYERNHDKQKLRDLRGNITLTGTIDETAKWIEEKQLLDAVEWAKFVNEFVVREDYTTGAWRGEYWGKMMRGAVYVYQYTKNPALYKTLEKTVRDILRTQDSLGRISTYPEDREFYGWDMWCRKYVMLGMEFFLEICEDEKLEKRIIRSLIRQCDYLCSKLGDEENKIKVTDTSKIWYGMNSASVLEPVMRLYRLTKKRKYMKLAKHIIKGGGTSRMNIFELAYRNELAPFEYGVSKAYEMMSCFEGLLEYYYETGNRKARLTVERFAKQVMKTDITVIGSAGCTHELFDNSYNRQTAVPEGKAVMQETCVTVTWMKLCSKLLKLTGDVSYADAMEKSFYNAYLGSLNKNGFADERARNDIAEGKAVYTFLPFDSYAPLTKGIRGIQAGGYQILIDKSYYGCCACIAAAGAGIFANSAAFESDDAVIISGYEDGSITFKTPAGQNCIVGLSGGYPYGDGTVSAVISLENNDTFTLKFRSPQGSMKTKAVIAGTEYRPSKGFITIEREWQNGDTIVLGFDTSLHVMKAPVYGKTTICQIDWATCETYTEEKIQTEQEKHMISLSRGPIVLAAERAVTGDIDSPIEPKSCADVKRIARDGYRFTADIQTRNRGKVTLCDYASAGQTWNTDTEMCAWIPSTEEYTGR